MTAIAFDWTLYSMASGPVMARSEKQKAISAFKKALQQQPLRQEPAVDTAHPSASDSRPASLQPATDDNRKAVPVDWMMHAGNNNHQAGSVVSRRRLALAVRATEDFIASREALNPLSEAFVSRSARASRDNNTDGGRLGKPLAGSDHAAMVTALDFYRQWADKIG